MERHWTSLSMECLYLVWHHCHSGDIEIFGTLGIWCFLPLHDSSESAPKWRRTFSVWFETLTGYPNARSPSTGVLVGLDDANLTYTVTIAHANDLATTSTPAPRAIETRITQHKVYEWCVVVATAIFMDRCSCRQKMRRRQSRRRFAEPLRDSRNLLHHTSSQPACTLVYFRVLTICHKDDTLCSSGQGTTSGFPKTRKGSVGGSASMLFWVKFIYTGGVSLGAFYLGQFRLRPTSFST